MVLRKSSSFSVRKWTFFSPNHLAAQHKTLVGSIICFGGMYALIKENV
jgi:hypothetical protein